MATAAVLPSRSSSPAPALDGCRSWWKCSAGSVPKLVDVVIPAAPSAPVAPATPASSATEEEEECAEEIVDDEEDDDFELDELTERALDAEEAYYAAASHKAPRMRKNDRFPLPRPKADHSRHALLRDSAAARHCADAIESLPTEALLIDALYNFWDEDVASSRLDGGVPDYARPIARLREQRILSDQLYIRKWRLRELRRDRSHPPSCRICLEDFGWRPVQTRKRVATLSYVDVLRIPRDPRKLVYTARHTLCDNSRCAICVECFKRDVELQMSKPRFLFSNRGIMNRSIGINCQGCNVRWSNDEWEQRHIISKILTPAQLDLLSARIMEAYLRTSPDIVACPGANCTALISVHPDSKCTCISCPACPLYFCYVCKVPYHFGRTCAEYLKDDPAAAWRAANTKPCPQCHTPIEKNGGCSHMHCALCNLDFTWTEHKFGVYLPPAAATRITLRSVRKGPPADFLAFCARHAKERLGADDDDAAAMLAAAEDEEEAAREAEAFDRDFDERTPDVVLIATRRRKNPSHTAHARNERHAAARVTRRLADRFPEIFPLARLAVAAA